MAHKQALTVGLMAAFLALTTMPGAADPTIRVDGAEATTASSYTSATGTYQNFYCDGPDEVAFTGYQRPDPENDPFPGEWMFFVVSAGNPGCLWAEAGISNGDGSPEEGFHGPSVYSDPWTIDEEGNFEVEISIRLDFGQWYTGTATGVLA